MTKEQIAEVKDRLPEYLESITGKRGTGWICPLCGSGTGPNGTAAGSIDKRANRYSCFSCGRTSLDTFDLIAEYEGLSKAEAFTRAAEIFNITDDMPIKGTKRALEGILTKNGTYHGAGDKNATQGNTGDKTSTPAKKDYTEYIKQAHSQIEKTDYFTRRGISPQTAARFALGYIAEYLDTVTGQTWQAAIIPTSPHSYTVRNTDQQAAPDNRYRKPGGAVIFNIKALQTAQQPIIITEGEIDALSVIEAGGEAIGLPGTTGARALLREFEHGTRPAQPLILALDNDGPGADAAAILEAGLKRQGIRYLKANIAGDGKDANQALLTDRALLTEAIQAATAAAAQLPETQATADTMDTSATKDTPGDTIIEYLAGKFADDIEEYKPYRDKKTGFAALDHKAGGVYPGLYVIGAAPSVGKTTFALQLADQLAAQGDHVLYFSLEQSKFELASKSLARITAQTDETTAKTAIEIRAGDITPAVIAAEKTYKETIGDRVSVIGGNFGMTAADIIDRTGQYIKDRQRKPIVIIDYLQILAGTVKHQAGRELIDENVTRIRQYCGENQLTVIVISSVNRSNYMVPFDYESLKESGGIEATADVVWGLQLAVISEDDIFSKDKHIKEKREAIKKAKAATPRRLELVCLKNRYGQGTYEITFKYFSKYDLFIEDEPHGEAQEGRPAVRIKGR